MTFYLGVLVFILACLFWWFEIASKAGEDKANNKAANEVIDDIYTAKVARERIDADRVAANKLRDTYTRD